MSLRPIVAEHFPDLRLIFHSKYAVEPVSGLQSGTLDVAFMRGPTEADGIEIEIGVAHDSIDAVTRSNAWRRRR